MDSMLGDSTSTEHAKKRFADTLADSGYRSLRQNTKIIGVWDDNDMGKNGGGAEFKLKDRNREIFLDFIGEDKDTERRLQKGTPIH